MARALLGMCQEYSIALRASTDPLALGLTASD
jgi:hypothetical protein